MIRTKPVTRITNGAFPVWAGVIAALAICPGRCCFLWKRTFREELVKAGMVDYLDMQNGIHFERVGKS